MTYSFDQLFQTLHSEQWKIIDGEGKTAGRVDVHFDVAAARVSIAVRADIEEADLDELVSSVDERLVPAKTRGDVRISVWRGESAGTFIPRR